MYINNKRIVLISVLLVIITSSIFAVPRNYVYEDCNEGWRYAFGDDLHRADEDFDYSLWKTLDIPAYVQMNDGDSKYIWFRNVITIPEELQNQPVYFNFGYLYGVCEIYVNGVLIGSQGEMPPHTNIRFQENSSILVPSSLIVNNKIKIALRIYNTTSETRTYGFAIGNKDHAYKMNYLQTVFNVRVYLVLATLCMFICLYFLIMYLADKNHLEYLFYSMSLLFISIYFFDMGSERLIFPLLIQRLIGRICLPISIGFMYLFIRSFYHRGKLKKSLIIVGIMDLLIIITYILCGDNESAINTTFTICLIPILVVIIYSLYTVITGVKNKIEDSLPILLGFVLGIAFSFYDIFYQLVGLTPFAWLQGYSFFSLNISVFIALSARSSRMQKKLDLYIKETANQRDRLNNILGSAENLAKETTSIALSLDSAVSEVADAASSSALEAQTIGSYVQKQNSTLGTTKNVVSELTESIRVVNKELESEASSITKTATETRQLLEAFESVGEGINGAAQFADSLNAVTSEGRKNVSLLIKSMDDVQKATNEVLGVAVAVNDFAEQTNLLAMNASIEAAHAGAAGKGFSVIALEIKKLAAASSSRATKISEIVNEILEAISVGSERSKLVNESLLKMDKEASDTANMVRDAANGMSVQREAGARISAESDALSVSAAKMREEAAKQYTFSDNLQNSMTDLSSVANDVGKSASGIVGKNKALAEEAEQLRALARQAREAVEKLNKIISTQQ